MSVPMNSQSVEDSHPTLLPEGLYFAMDLLTFLKCSTLSGTFLVLVLGLFFYFFCFYFIYFPPCFWPFIAWCYLDSIAQLPLCCSFLQQVLCSLNINVHLLYASCLTCTHKQTSTVSSQSSLFNATFQTLPHNNRHSKMNVLHWRQILLHVKVQCIRQYV